MARNRKRQRQQQGIRILAVPVAQYRQLYLAFSAADALVYINRWNEHEASDPTGFMAVADMHKLCTVEGQTKGLRSCQAEGEIEEPPRKQA